MLAKTKTCCGTSPRCAQRACHGRGAGRALRANTRRAAPDVTDSPARRVSHAWGRARDGLARL